MNTSMWNDSENEFTPELGSDEHLLWTGRPRSGVLFRSSDLFLIPFSLIWGGFAIFWEINVFFTNAPTYLMLWGVPFVVIGLYLICGRFMVDAQQRKKTHYGITNERVIMISLLFRRSVKSVNLETLADISLTENSDGTGTITLGPIHPFYGMFGETNWPGTRDSSPPSLEWIENARSVYETIRLAQRDLKNSAK